MVAASMPDHESLLFLLFGMLGISYTRRGLLCEGLSSQNVDGRCDLFEFILDDRASHDTNLQFSSVVPQVSIFCYFGILDDGLYRPHKRCRGYILCVRLAFFSLASVSCALEIS